MNARFGWRRAARTLSLAAVLVSAGLAPGTAAAARGDAPVNLTRPSISGAARDGETLQASAGTWTGAGPFAHSYRWQRCNTTAGTRNVALGRTAWASSALPANAPAHAVDGSTETWWSAGDFAPQWIEIDLGAPHPVRGIRLTASQSPPGYTLHEVWARGPAAGDAYQRVAAFEGGTADGSQLSASFVPVTDVQFVAVETLISPSWVGWREIELFAECADIPGATGSAYAVTPDEIGLAIRVVVTATNSAGSVAAASPESAPVTAFSPQNLTPPVIEGIARKGELLTAQPGSWRGTPPVEFLFHWQRCDRTGAACVDLDAGEIDTYLLGAADAGRRIRVRVVARNAGGEAEALSAATPVVTPLPVSRRCVVPSVRRRTLAAARRAIRRAGCAVGRIRRVRSARANGRVVSQTPRPGVRRARGTRVNLVVSKGRR